MILFIKGMFGYFVAKAIMRSIILCFAKYPRKDETPAGVDVVILLVSIGIAIWAAYLLGHFK